MMTLKQIAKNNALDYGTVYQGAVYAGVLVRRTKNYEYDEETVLNGVAEYLGERIERHQKKIDELAVDRENVMRKLGGEQK